MSNAIAAALEEINQFTELTKVAHDKILARHGVDVFDEDLIEALIDNGWTYSIDQGGNPEGLHYLKDVS